MLTPDNRNGKILVVRCRPRVTTVGTLPARTLYVGAGAIAEVVPVASAFRHASAYRASSSAPGVATVSVSGSRVTVIPAATGVATITVTARDAAIRPQLNEVRVAPKACYHGHFS